MANGHDTHFPVWAQVLLRIGVYPAITLFVIWWVLSRLAPAIDDIVITTKGQAQVTAQILEQIKENGTDQAWRQQQMIDIVRQNCLNTAEGQKMRETCFYPDPRPR